MDGYVFLLGLILTVGITVLIYLDAKNNSPHPPFLWALVVFFGGLIGVLVYLLVGRKY